MIWVCLGQLEGCVPVLVARLAPPSGAHEHHAVVALDAALHALGVQVGIVDLISDLGNLAVVPQVIEIIGALVGLHARVEL